MEEFKTPERITFKHLWDMTRSVLNFERGLPYTLWQFLIYPKKATKEYLFGNRRKFMDPIKFLFLSVTIAAFVLIQNLGTDDAMLQQMLESAKDEQQKKILIRFNELISNYYNLFFFLNVPFYAMATKLLYNKKDYFFAEHLTISAYLYAAATYTMPLLLFAPNSMKGIVITVLSTFISVYLIWAYMKIFEENWINGLWKGILVVLIASVIYVILLSGITGVIVGYQIASEG